MHQTGSDAIESFNGLGKRNPLMAFILTIALFSLAGIPPTAGFFAKYYILTAAMTGGHNWLAIIGILSSLVGIYYYFKIIIAMYFKKPTDESLITINKQHQLLLIVTGVIIFLLGLLPDLILSIGDIDRASIEVSTTNILFLYA